MLLIPAQLPFNMHTCGVKAEHRSNFIGDNILAMYSQSGVTPLLANYFLFHKDPLFRCR